MPGNIPLKIVQLVSPSKSILVCDGEFKYYHHVSQNTALGVALANQTAIMWPPPGILGRPTTFSWMDTLRN